MLSLFPVIGLLDMAFELEGFCVVRGPDVLWPSPLAAALPIWLEQQEIERQSVR